MVWKKMCFDYITKQGANPNADPAIQAINVPTSATFQITDTKLYARVVTLSTEDTDKLLQQIKSGFKRAIKWNK